MIFAGFILYFGVFLGLFLGFISKDEMSIGKKKISLLKQICLVVVAILLFLLVIENVYAAILGIIFTYFAFFQKKSYFLELLFPFFLLFIYPHPLTAIILSMFLLYIIVRYSEFIGIFINKKDTRTYTKEKKVILLQGLKNSLPLLAGILSSFVLTIILM